MYVLYEYNEEHVVSGKKGNKYYFERIFQDDFVDADYFDPKLYDGKMLVFKDLEKAKQVAIDCLRQFAISQGDSVRGHYASYKDDYEFRVIRLRAKFVYTTEYVDEVQKIL